MESSGLGAAESVASQEVFDPEWKRLLQTLAEDAVGSDSDLRGAIDAASIIDTEDLVDAAVGTNEGMTELFGLSAREWEEYQAANRLQGQRDTGILRRFHRSGWGLLAITLAGLATLWILRSRHHGFLWPLRGWTWWMQLLVLLAFSTVGLFSSFLLSLYDFDSYAATTWIVNRFTDLERVVSATVEAKERLGDAIRKGIVLRLTQEINKRREKSYSLRLEVRSARGLAEVGVATYQIETVERMRLTRLLDTMPTGAIGVSGPRGIGKSALLGYFCEPRGSTVEEGAPDGHSTLRVLVSAPVHYDAREFILYLFGHICRAVLGIAEGDPPTPPGFYSLPRARIGRVLLRLLGFVSTLAGVGVALLRLLHTRNLPPIAAAMTLAIGGIVLVVYGSRLRLRHSSRPSRVSSRYLVELGRLGVQLRFVGAILLAAGIVISIARLLRVDNLQLNASIAAIIAGAAVLGLTRPRWSPMNQQLAYRAQLWLEAIRFQQTYTSGWSGSLKSSVADVGLSMQRSAAEAQRTYPEIVAGFREFLLAATGGRQKSSRRYFSTYDGDYVQVIIGIDEMDKIASDEAAQGFLNELKALFGIPRCVFLVSVSENAMSNFERRGLPFRDVFDSAFDEIVYLDYLQIGDARQVLSRRVVSFSEPFVQLSHALSGGLARDLIRVARDVVELRAKRATMIWEIAARLIQDEATAKIRATTVAAHQVSHPATATLLSRLQEVVASGCSAAVLLSAATGLYDDRTALGAALGDVQVRRMAALQLEMAGFCFYLATLGELFDESMTEEVARDLERKGASPGGIEHLARIRQAFSADAALAWSALCEFRRVRGMQPIFEQGTPDGKEP